ncbi:MAG: nucleotide exchange factor GrpE [Spirochaetaceae bacterium]
MSGEERRFDDRATDKERTQADQAAEQYAAEQYAQNAGGDGAPEDTGNRSSESAVPGNAGGDAPAAEEGASAQAAEDAQDEVGRLLARVQELEQENSDLKDQYLRKQADFENFRKRMAREKADAIAYANKQLLLDLVTIIDDFERAIKSAEESRDFDSFHEGVALIEKQFTNMLESKWGLKRFDSEGQEFDPQKHEALMSEEASDVDHPVVVEDFQKGYFLNDKVLRSAKVKVAVPAESNEGAGTEENVGGGGDGAES